MNRWNGKVAVVTGASAGIGCAIAEYLVDHGLMVVGLARRKEKLDDLFKKLEKKSGKFYPVITDISKEEDILNAFNWITTNVGIVHILINNAGIGYKNNLIDGSANNWKNVLDTNLLGLCITTREAVKIMRTHNVDGHIVHLNSVAGHQVSTIKDMNVYPASKHGVTALTETLRQELNSIGSKIKITSISPGFVKTELAGVYAKDLDSLAMLAPEDIADAVVYVLSTPPHVQVHEVIIKPVGELV